MMSKTITRKVLYVIDNLGAGGIERQTVELAKGFDRTQYTPEFLCFYGEKSGRSTQFYDVLYEAGISVSMLDLKMNPMAKVRAWLAIMHCIWASGADIVHSVNYHGNILLGYTRPFIPHQTRLIVSVRANNTAKQMRNQMFSWQRCAAIITNAAHLKEELKEKAGLPDSKIMIIPNGLDIEHFSKPGDPAFRDQLNADFIILMVGRFSPVKSPQTLIEALGILAKRDELKPRTKLVIVGEHEHTETIRQVNALVKQYHLNEFVQFFPETNEIEKFYHAADVTVLPSLREGLPNVVLEALASGCPVIVSEAANQAGVIQQGINGWMFRTQDAPHLAETLKYFFALSEKKRLSIQQECKASVTDFSMEKMVEQHQRIYDEVLSKRS